MRSIEPSLLSSHSHSTADMPTEHSPYAPLATLNKYSPTPLQLILTHSLHPLSSLHASVHALAAPRTQLAAQTKGMQVTVKRMQEAYEQVELVKRDAQQ
jgi:hypothetical protein